MESQTLTVYNTRLLVEKIMEKKSPLSKESVFTNRVEVLAIGIEFPQSDKRQVIIGDILLVSGVQEFDGIEDVYVMPSQILRWV